MIMWDLRERPTETVEEPEDSRFHFWLCRHRTNMEDYADLTCCTFSQRARCVLFTTLEVCFKSALRASIKKRRSCSQNYVPTAGVITPTMQLCRRGAR